MVKQISPKRSEIPVETGSDSEPRIKAKATFIIKLKYNYDNEGFKYQVSNCTPKCGEKFV